MICRIDKRRVGYDAVVIHQGRPRVTTRIHVFTRKGAERVLIQEGCSNFGRARPRRRRR
jgi:hypothetical protein